MDRPWEPATDPQAPGNQLKVSTNGPRNTLHLPYAFAFNAWSSYNVQSGPISVRHVISKLS
jgi:hypothetical protein